MKTWLKAFGIALALAGSILVLSTFAAWVIATFKDGGSLVLLGAVMLLLLGVFTWLFHGELVDRARR